MLSRRDHIADCPVGFSVFLSPLSSSGCTTVLIGTLPRTLLFCYRCQKIWSVWDSRSTVYCGLNFPTFHTPMTQPARLVFGASAAIAKVLEASERFARSPNPLLILGERGTGKSVLAQRVHHLSGRPGSFEQTSVLAIPPNLEISCLAGHRRGAFTGAVSDHTGLIELAHRGTFFLDEVGLAPPLLQQLLLGFLETRRIRRFGDTRDTLVDTRFVAATNEDLDQLVASGRFRADLHDRFGYLVLRLPPLRERRDEILPLAKHFLTLGAAGTDHTSIPTLSKEVRACLVGAPWSGNIRQLRNVCNYALAVAPPGGTIHLDHLPPAFMAELKTVPRIQYDKLTKLQLHEALQRAKGNRSRAAHLLAISRTHFYRLLNQ